MPKLLISLCIGVIAGVIDVVPMIAQKLDKYSSWSAFVHWIVLAVIISYIQLPMPPWLKGLVVAEISAVPIIILVMKDDMKSIFPILIMSAVLGIAVGIATSRFAA
ncbi:MAG: hypothetical protein HKM93_00605 [Desulfobacteraceae bacterium]|nr:hypothetical protein [Desulfobacteraceae bacterium]